MATKKPTTKIYIGIVGEKGSGKDTIPVFLRELLPHKKIGRVTFSDVLSETLDLWVLPKTRANYQRLVPMMVETFGGSTLANITKFRAERLKADIVCIPGMRWFEDLRMVKSLNNKNGARSFVVYVTAPAKTRFLRSKKRGEKADEKKSSFRKFMKEEKARTEVDIPKIAKRADLTIVNDGTMEEFRNIVKQRLVPLITGKKKP